MKNILNFKKFYESNYNADHAIEDLFYKIYDDYYLDNRDDILDNVYTTLDMRTINWAYEDLLDDYPELEDYKDEFYKAAETEGYFIMKNDHWADDDF